ncbi:MAG: SRPBCC family protein, partial [Anaerolineales bacterium]
MAIPIEERFAIAAPIAQVWAYFSDPPRVAPCLPGAELIEVVGEKTYKGRVQVKVGQIGAQYQGTVVVEKIDRQNWAMVLVARGDQSGAAGRAEARIAFSLRSLAKENTEVVIRVELSIAGRLAQLGSGLIQTVSKQLFR